jgi:hypothetical protein
MPDDKGTGVDLEQYQKDKEEFTSTVDDLLAMDEDKTDEDIIKELDEKKGKKVDTDDASGDAPKDPDKPKEPAETPAKDSIDDLIAADQSGVVVDDTTNDTGTAASSDGDDWQKKAETVEAELKKERQKTASWGGRITKANTRVTELEAEVKKVTEANTSAPSSTDSDDDVLDELKNDFPELSGAFDVLQKRIDDIKEGSEAKVVDDPPASPDVDVEPNKPTTHLDDIRKVHKDLDEMVGTGVLKTWINQQADYIRPHLDKIYNEGNVTQVIDMVKRFKDTTGWKSQLANPEEEKKKAQKKKLDDLKEVNSEGGGPPAEGPDKQDFDGAAKEAFAE